MAKTPIASITPNIDNSPEQLSERKTCLITAWLVTLLVSAMPDIIFREALKMNISWLFQLKLASVVLILMISIILRRIVSLRQYLIIIILLYVFEWLSSIVSTTHLWTSTFGNSSTFSIPGMMGKQLLRTGVAVMMIVVLLIIKKTRSTFFLVKGQLDAIAAPVLWIGMKRPASWKKFGAMLSICISLGTLVFLMISDLPTPARVYRTLPLFPFILLFAAMNSFGEEMNYRASFLGAMDGAIDRNHSLLITAGYFGIGHYYGVPYGIIGVIMASLLGWMLGKSMLETRGFFWAWFIHFLQDIMIFTFMAIGSVTPGG